MSNHAPVALDLAIKFRAENAHLIDSTTVLVDEERDAVIDTAEFFLAWLDTKTEEADAR